MAWSEFKRKVLRVMNSGPQSSDDVANAIVDAYHQSVTMTGVSGDLINKRTITTVSPDRIQLTKDAIKLIFRLQAANPVPLPITQQIVTAIGIYYWPLAISDGPTPFAVAPPGPIIVGTFTALFAGPAVELPLPAQTAEQWVDKLILTMKLQLFTIQGTFVVQSGLVTLPGVWTGYKIGETLGDTLTPPIEPPPSE
jgi:hypothetical protein